LARKRRVLHEQKINGQVVRAPLPADPRPRGDTVTIQVTDPACMGVTDSRGRRWDARDGRIELPRAEAERILRSGHPEVRVYRRTWGFHDADIWGPDGRLRRKESGADG
jgi:hypothetical protein